MTSNSEARKRHEEPLTTVSHNQGNSDKKVTAHDSDSVVTVMDYLRSEAERLPGGTAAKVLAMTTTTPFDSNDHNFGGDAAPNHHDRCDCGEDTIIGCGSRPDRCCGLNADEDTVTITISRATAESVVRDLPEASADFAFGRVALACRAALEAQHEYDNSPDLQALLRRAVLEGER